MSGGCVLWINATTFTHTLAVCYYYYQLHYENLHVYHQSIGDFHVSFIRFRQIGATNKRKKKSRALFAV